MTGPDGLEPNEPPEVVERDLIAARGPLKYAAAKLGEAGHEEAAATVAVLGVEEDRDRMAGLFWLASESAEPEQRDLALEAVFDVANVLADNGKHAAAGRLCEVLEAAGSVYGLPGDRE